MNDTKTLTLLVGLSVLDREVGVTIDTVPTPQPFPPTMRVTVHGLGGATYASMGASIHQAALRVWKQVQEHHSTHPCVIELGKKIT